MDKNEGAIVIKESKKLSKKILKKFMKKPSYREEANALTHQCLRLGFIEELHAGKYSKLLENPKFSRITQEEMKKLIIETSSKLAEFLKMKDKNTEKYNRKINSITLLYTHGWDKKLKRYNIK